MVLEQDNSHLEWKPRVAVCIISVVSGCNPLCIPDPRDIAEEGQTDCKGCARYIGVSVWSGHSGWLFSCSLYIPCPTSSCFTCTLCTQLTILLLALGPSWWLFLSKGLWGTCASAVSLVTNEPTWPQFQPWESRLPPYSACCLLHTVGCCSKTLLQTCTLPGLLNHWCLCCWLGLFLQSLKLGKQQALWAWRVWPNNLRSSQETEETPVSAEMFGNTGQGMESCGGHPLTFGAQKLRGSSQKLWGNSEVAIH